MPSYTSLIASKPVVANTSTLVDEVTAVATDKVEVTFTKALQSLNQGDFSVEGHEIAYSELSSDGKKATFTLKTKLPENVKITDGSRLLKLVVVGTPSSVDILGERIGTIGAKDITDGISATVKAIAASDLSGTKIKITFNEAINITSASEVKTDFVVKDNVGRALTVTGVALGAAADELIITVDRPVIAATISAENVRFVKDGATNAIADIEARTVELNPDLVAPSLSSVAGTVATGATTEATLAFTSNEAGTYYYVVYEAADVAPTVDQVIAQGTAIAKGTAAATAAANSVTVTALTTGIAYKAYVVVVDATGNKSVLGTTSTFTTN